MVCKLLTDARLTGVSALTQASGTRMIASCARSLVMVSYSQNAGPAIVGSVDLDVVPGPAVKNGIFIWFVGDDGKLYKYTYADTPVYVGEYDIGATHQWIVVSGSYIVVPAGGGKIASYGDTGTLKDSLACPVTDAQYCIADNAAKVYVFDGLGVCAPVGVDASGSLLYGQTPETTNTNLIPTMTSATVPAPYVFTDIEFYVGHAWHIFDNINTNDYAMQDVSSPPPIYGGFTVDLGTPAIVNGCLLRSFQHGAIQQITAYGSTDGVTYTVLGSFNIAADPTTANPPTSASDKTYTFNNDTAYRYYKFLASSGGGGTIQLFKMQLHQTIHTIDVDTIAVPGLRNIVSGYFNAGENKLVVAGRGCITTVDLDEFTASNENFGLVDIFGVVDGLPLTNTPQEDLELDQWFPPTCALWVNGDRALVGSDAGSCLQVRIGA